MTKRILREKVKIPKKKIGPECRKFLSSLICPLGERMGVKECKEHEWLKEMEWEKLFKGEVCESFLFLFFFFLFCFCFCFFFFCFFFFCFFLFFFCFFLFFSFSLFLFFSFSSFSSFSSFFSFSSFSLSF